MHTRTEQVSMLSCITPWEVGNRTIIHVNILCAQLLPQFAAQTVTQLQYKTNHLFMPCNIAKPSGAHHPDADRLGLGYHLGLGLGLVIPPYTPLLVSQYFYIHFTFPSCF